MVTRWGLVGLYGKWIESKLSTLPSSHGEITQLRYVCVRERESERAWGRDELCIYWLDIKEGMKVGPGSFSVSCMIIPPHLPLHIQPSIILFLSLCGAVIEEKWA